MTHRAVLLGAILPLLLFTAPSASGQTFIWSGAGGDSNWHTDPNWSTGSSPYTAANPPDIVLGSGPSNRTTTLNQSLAINSLTVSAAGYTIGVSNSAVLTLGNPSVAGSGTVNVSANVSSSIAAPVSLVAPAGSNQFFTVNSSGSFTVTGAISGSSGSILNKQGLGDLILNANSAGFTGPITVNAGTLRIGNGNALGSNTGVTTVAVNASLDLNGQTVAGEPLSLSGTGTGVTAALANTAATAASNAGTITLNANSSIGGAGAIVLSGQISDVGAGQSLTKVGAGPLTLGSAGGNTYRGDTFVSAGPLIVNNTSGSGTGTGQVRVNGGQLAGTGSMTGAVTVSSGARLRGGDPTAPLGPANRVLTANGGVTVNGGSTVQVAFAGSGGGVSDPTLVQFTNGFNVGTGPAPVTALNQLLVNVSLDSGPALTALQPVSLTLASGTGGFTLNGTPAPSTIDPTLYTATFNFDVVPGSVGLTTSGTSLTLGFTPVPEPSSLLELAVAAGFGVRLLRRRR